MNNSDCAVSKPAMKNVIQNANCTKNVPSEKEFRGWISILASSCFESGKFRAVAFAIGNHSDHALTTKMQDRPTLCKKSFCFVWRPAPHHTVPSTAPLP